MSSVYLVILCHPKVVSRKTNIFYVTYEKEKIWYYLNQWTPQSIYFELQFLLLRNLHFTKRSKIAHTYLY
jgi:hypothetical protein